MADYKESEVSGKQWQRCRAIEIDNPYGAMPVVRFFEELRTQVGGQGVAVPVGGITQNFDDPAKTFPLRNPMTGELVGATATYGEVYGLLWSLYMALAEERDATSGGA